MKVYHTTAIENKESIIEFGINAMVTDKITDSEDQIDCEGVFVFDNEKSAHDFGVDNFGEFAIFEMNITDELQIDPEYDGEALFINRAIESNEVSINKIVE